jgi:hypothetical protein
MSTSDSAALRVYTAPGEAADLQEMLDADRVEIHEVDHLGELHDADDPGVLFLSRGLLGRGSHEAIAALPRLVAVVAADEGARSAAEQVGRLFLAAPDLVPGEAPLMRALQSAGRHARVEAELLRVAGTTTDGPDSP